MVDNTRIYILIPTDKYETIKEYSYLHKQLNLDFEDYSKKIVDLEELKTKGEFLDYVYYYQIDKWFLASLCIRKCKYLEYLHEYVKTEISYILKVGNPRFPHLNDKNLKYVSQYIDIVALNASDNSEITTVEPFGHTLIKLDASDSCGIDDEGLKNAIKLNVLVAWNNENITTTKPFGHSLIELSAGGSGINDEGMKHARNLTTLKIENSDNITDEGIKHLTHLKELRINENTKITTIKPFINFTKVAVVDDDRRRYITIAKAKEQKRLDEEMNIVRVGEHLIFSS